MPLFLLWFNDCMQNSVVAWEVQCGEGHVLDVGPLAAGVVLRCLDHDEFSTKQNEVLGIDVTLLSLFLALAGFV